MSQITILCSYFLAAALLSVPRIRTGAVSPFRFDLLACILAAFGVGLHAYVLWHSVFASEDLRLHIAAVASLIGLVLATMALLITSRQPFRGLAALLLLSAALLFIPDMLGHSSESGSVLSLPLKLHAASSLIAYSLLAVSAILAIGALTQDRQLRAARTGGWVALLPPLAQTERLSYAVAVAGFIGLLVSISTGFAFVNDLFAQHLAHKTLLSLAAAVLLGIVITARAVRGWRGRTSLYLLLSAFLVLALAYFGSRLILEVILGKQWG